jgi:hypothetical protein
MNAPHSLPRQPFFSGKSSTGWPRPRGNGRVGLEMARTRAEWADLGLNGQPFGTCKLRNQRSKSSSTFSIRPRSARELRWGTTFPRTPPLAEHTSLSTGGQRDISPTRAPDANTRLTPDAKRGTAIASFLSHELDNESSLDLYRVRRIPFVGGFRFLVSLFLLALIRVVRAFRWPLVIAYLTVPLLIYPSLLTFCKSHYSDQGPEGLGQSALRRVERGQRKMACNRVHFDRGWKRKTD